MHEELKKIKGRLGAIALKDCKANGEKSVFYKKHKYYTFLLYPDNPSHMWLLEYFKSYGYQGFLAIKHEADKEQDSIFNGSGGDDSKNTCKPHYHCIICYNYSKSFLSAITDLEKYGIFYTQPVNSVQDLIIYFLHKTPSAVSARKEQYDFDDLLYNGSFVKVVDRLRVSFSDSNRVSPYKLLLGYVQICDSPIDFYMYGMSNPVLDDFLKTHQLIFENMLKRKFYYN